MVNQVHWFAAYVMAMCCVMAYLEDCMVGCPETWKLLLQDPDHGDWQAGNMGA